MSIRATLIATILLALVGGCSSSSEERSATADQTQHSGATSELPAVTPPPPIAGETVPPPAVRIKDLPPNKVIAPAEAEGPLQAKLPDSQEMAVTPPPPYRPLDLPPSGQAGQLAPFPQEVTNFMVERDSCDHFRGEEPYDADRRAYLEENIAELCSGTDGRLAALRIRYASNATVIAALSGYEDRIESGTGNSKYIGK